MKDVILYFTLKYNGDWEKIYSAIESKEQIPINKLVGLQSKLKYSYTSIIDRDYPDNLKEIYKPPFSLFWKGSKELFNSKLISIFGDFKYEEIKELRNKYNDDCFVIEYCEKNRSIIESLVKDGIRFIAISQGNIDDIFEEEFTNKVIENNLIVSEYTSEAKNDFVEQSWIRVSIGLSLRPIIKFEESQLESNLATQIAVNDNIKVYSYGLTDKLLISKYRFLDWKSKNTLN